MTETARPNEQLARHLAAATVANQMGITFDAAMRTYVKPQDQVGELWKVAAQFILDCQAEAGGPISAE